MFSLMANKVHYLVMRLQRTLTVGVTLDNKVLKQQEVSVSNQDCIGALPVFRTKAAALRFLGSKDSNHPDILKVTFKEGKVE